MSQLCPGGQESQWHPGLHQQFCGQQDQGRDWPPVLGTAEATPGILCPVLGPSLQEKHGGAGVCPEKGNELLKDLEHRSEEHWPKELGLFQIMCSSYCEFQFRQF